jgi:hypothetical protein
LIQNRCSIALALMASAALSVTAAVSPDPDRVFTPQGAFISAADKGLGGAGCALPWGLESVFENPALLYSCRNSAAHISRSAAAGYGRDSLFDRYIIPVGLSYSHRRNATALNFRALSSSSGLDEYEASATLCRRVSGSASVVGPIDIGVNIRYEYADWKKRGLDTLASLFSFLTPAGGNYRPDSTVKNGLPPERGEFRQHRLFFDLGVFMPGIADNVDCGVMVKNPTGFFYGNESPDTVVMSGRVGTLQDTVAIMRTARSYGGGSAQSAGVAGLKYASLCIGMNYRMPGPAGGFALSFPIDVEVYGMLDPKIKSALAVRCGVQAHIAGNFFVRLGYSHAPGPVPADFKRLPFVNDVSLGASILPPGLPAVIDCYFSHYDWGMNVGVDY